jgi:hypothetical protein
MQMATCEAVTSVAVGEIVDHFTFATITEFTTWLWGCNTTHTSNTALIISVVGSNSYFPSAVTLIFERPNLQDKAIFFAFLHSSPLAQPPISSSPLLL